MISAADLSAIAAARLDDAKALVAASRLEGAIYLSGYAIEMALKARICVTLDWVGFPSGLGEFAGLSNFKTHDLDVLLKLSGMERRLKANAAGTQAWSVVRNWYPELRYRPIGSVTPADAHAMIQAVQTLLGVL